MAMSTPSIASLEMGSNSQARRPSRIASSFRSRPASIMPSRLRAAAKSRCLSTVLSTSLRPVSISELLESEKVARVQLKGMLQVARGLVPVAFAAVDHAGVSEYISAVGQCAPGDNELTASPSVIAESVVVINGQGEVGFARIRLKA